MTFFPYNTEVTSATCPGLSSFLMINVGQAPVQFTVIPSSSLSIILPPPRDDACTTIVFPSTPSTSKSAVFGCASLICVLYISNSSPSCFATEKLSGIRISSGFIPKSPATRARSVPCPLPVAAKEPLNPILAFFGRLPSSFLVI